MYARRSYPGAVTGMSALMPWVIAPAAAHGPAGQVGGPSTGAGSALITDLEVVPVRDVGGNRFEDRVLTGTTIGEGR